MIALAIILGLVALALLVTIYLLGFRLGGHASVSALQQVRLEAAAAQRQLHQLIRSAFVATAEEAQRQRDGRR